MTKRRIYGSFLLIALSLLTGLILGSLISDDEINKEIERKWLIKADDIPYDLSIAEVYKIEQTYINYSPEIRVRKVNDGEYYTFTLKVNMTFDGITRDEVDYRITREEYDELIMKKVGSTIVKTRYQFAIGGERLVAVDIFHGELEGLAYMEIEFSKEKEAKEFKTPSWVIEDVTDKPKYKNAQLSKNGLPN